MLENCKQTCVYLRALFHRCALTMEPSRLRRKKEYTWHMLGKETTLQQIWQSNTNPTNYMGPMHWHSPGRLQNENWKRLRTLEPGLESWEWATLKPHFIMVTLANNVSLLRPLKYSALVDRNWHSAMQKKREGCWKMPASWTGCCYPRTALVKGTGKNEENMIINMEPQ